MKKKETKRKGLGKTITLLLVLVLIGVGIGFSFKPIFKNLKFGLDLQGGFEVLYKVVGIGFSFKPIFKNLKFGLDLQGGFEVLYKVESIDGSKMNSDKMQATYKTLSKRIDSLGVNEPEIILEGDDRIRVKLAGVKNEDEARKQLSTVATLSFRDVDNNLLMDSNVLNASNAAKVGQDSAGNPAVSLVIQQYH